MSSHVSYVPCSRFVLPAPACQAAEKFAIGNSDGATNLWGTLMGQLIYGGHCDGETYLWGTVMGQLIYGDTLMGQLIYGGTFMGQLIYGAL